MISNPPTHWLQVKVEVVQCLAFCSCMTSLRMTALWLKPKVKALSIKRVNHHQIYNKEASVLDIGNCSSNFFFFFFWPLANFLALSSCLCQLNQTSCKTLHCSRLGAAGCGINASTKLVVKLFSRQLLLWFQFLCLFCSSKAQFVARQQLSGFLDLNSSLWALLSRDDSHFRYGHVVRIQFHTL